VSGTFLAWSDTDFLEFPGDAAYPRIRYGNTHNKTDGGDLNASDDTVDMLQTMLAARGHVGVSGRADDVKSGELDFIDFMETHNLTP
jgi:hypothetical protein